MTLHYLVLESDDKAKLAERVETAISEGWRLQGGISVAVCVEPCREAGNGDYVSAEYTLIYAQAVTIHKP